MGAQVCVGCDLRLPARQTRCPICQGSLDYHIWEFPDEDWEERVEAASKVIDDAPDKVVLNRANRLHDAGLSWEDAIWYAGARNGTDGGFEVDVSDFERLAAQAGPTLAAEIRKPVSSPPWQS